MTKAEEKKVAALIATIERKLSNIEAGMRFEAMVRLHAAEKRLDEALKEHHRAAAICDRIRAARTPRRGKARR